MKIAKLEWCTEQAQNQGRLVYLRASVKPITNYKTAKFLELGDVGTRSTFCQEVRFDEKQKLQKIDVFYDTTSV